MDPGLNSCKLADNIAQLRQLRHHVRQTYGFDLRRHSPWLETTDRGKGEAMFEMLNRWVRLAFIDERPASGDRGEPILLIHGFASTHAVNWVFPQWVNTLTGAGRR